MVVYLQGLGRAVGLAVDVREGLVFWSEITPGQESIWKAELSGTRARPIITGMCVFIFTIT